MSAVFSLILLFRLDEVALMKKFAAFDFGKSMLRHIACLNLCPNMCVIIRDFFFEVVGRSVKMYTFN